MSENLQPIRKPFETRRKACTAFSLILILTVGRTDIFAQEDAFQAVESTSVDAEELTASTPESPKETEYLGPVDFACLGRFDASISQIRKCIEFADQIANQQDWHSSSLLAEICDSLNDEDFDAKLLGKLDAVCFEFHLGMQPGGIETVGLVQIIVFPLSYKETFALMDEEENLESIVFDEAGFGYFEDGNGLILKSDNVSVIAAGDTRLESVRPFMIEALERFKNSPPKHTCSYTFEPRRIPSHVRAAITSTIVAGLSASAQQRDGESEFEFRTREVWVKPLISAIDLLSNQIESITYSFDRDDSAQQVRCVLDVKAVAKSNFEYWINRQHETRCKALSWLHPQHDSFFSVSLVLPEVVTTTLPFFSGALLDALGEAGLLAPHNLAECKRTVQGMIDGGSLQLLAQSVPVGPGAFDVLVTQPLPRESDLTSTAIELASAQSLGDWIVAFSEIDGWPVHLLPDIMSGESATTTGITFPSDLQFCATDTALQWHFCSKESHSLLSDVVKREFDETPDSQRFRRSAITLKTDCRFLFSRIAQTDDWPSFFPPVSATSGEADRSHEVTATLDADRGHLSLTATFERNAVVVGICSYSEMFLLLVQGLDL